MHELRQGIIGANSGVSHIQFSLINLYQRSIGEYFKKVDIQFPSAVIDKIIGLLDLNLKSGEGDLLHQHIDCVFFGAYNKTFFAHTDSNSILEPLMYSRHKNGESREFDLPCNASIVYDTYTENISSSAFLQKTCGSDARIGLMAYVKKNIVKEQNSLNIIMTAKIKDKMKRVKKSFSNIRLFGCKPHRNAVLWPESAHQQSPHLKPQYQV